MRKILFTLAASCLLTACDSSTTPSRVIPPADLTQPCDTIPGFYGKDMGDLLKYTVGLAGQYRQCAARQNALAGWERSR